MRIILVSFILTMSFNSPGQEIEKIFVALGDGDVTSLSSYLSPRAEIHVMDRVSVYNKQAAIKVLRKFYSEFPPVSYKRIHRGTSRAQDSLYSIGSLTTNEGNFRVYLYVKRKNGRILIEELRFDKD